MISEFITLTVVPRHCQAGESLAVANASRQLNDEVQLARLASCVRLIVRLKNRFGQLLRVSSIDMLNRVEVMRSHDVTTFFDDRTSEFGIRQLKTLGILGTNGGNAESNRSTGRRAPSVALQALHRWGLRVSFGEPIALRGHVKLDQAASATSGDVRSAVEAQFIDRLKAGDSDAFDELVTERSGDVYALLYRLTNDPEEARDLTQETFLRTFQNIGRFRGDADLKTWIYRIAVNQARNRWRWWRRRRRDVTVSLDAGDQHSDEALGARLRDTSITDPEQQALARERENALMNALESVSRSYREAVILRDIEGLSYEDVAATLEISIGTVKSRLARGRNELRLKLGGSL